MGVPGWPAVAGRLTADGLTVVRSVVARLTDDVVGVAVGVAVLFVALNGVRFLASNGNPHRQADAKAGLVAAGVGLAITLAAGLLVSLVVAAVQ